MSISDSEPAESRCTASGRRAPARTALSRTAQAHRVRGHEAQGTTGRGHEGAVRSGPHGHRRHRGHGIGRARVPAAQNLRAAAQGAPRAASTLTATPVCNCLHKHRALPPAGHSAETRTFSPVSPLPVKRSFFRELGAWAIVRVTGPAVGRKDPPCTGFVGAKLFAARLVEFWTFLRRYKNLMVE